MGVDLLPHRVAAARAAHPELEFHAGNAERLEFGDECFDLVMVYTVFSSILDETMGSHVAAEIVRVMKPGGPAKMIRIHFGEDDRWQGKPLYEAIVEEARRQDLAGATVYRGIEGYGASGRIHKRPVWRSKDEPITVVIVDAAEKIEKALPYLDQMIGNGLVAISDVDVILYKG